MTSTTNPLSQTTGYRYDTLGRLASVVNANAQTAVTYTYDGFDRVATATDSEGWTVGYAYDRLDLASHHDRLGRVWWACGWMERPNRNKASLTGVAGSG